LWWRQFPGWEGVLVEDDTEVVAVVVEEISQVVAVVV
jgi:hypothetical protein